MQFVSNGPDIPNELLQAHEEGRVVFFCGAGISYPAGLPDFRGLVDKIYKNVDTSRSPIEQEAFGRGQFDATLDLLERRLPGDRLVVRNALMKALKTRSLRKNATDTHAALLCLARNREHSLRLVTTNFDRLFHSAARRTKQTFEAYAAPLLPVPKNSRWNGIVYLHGLLPEGSDRIGLNRLVVTSGDFGLAYLTERWAARFVSELFRNYVVCFVGYSINDPVLRYMMDALAADRMLGEYTPQAWALGDFEDGQKEIKDNEWRAKGVKPILYNVAPGSDDHSTLHQTLQVWADVYRDGIQGKEAIVVQYAWTRPQNSTKQDDFVGRMLWALSDKSGLPAKRFADAKPTPPLDWLLEAFADERFGYQDLLRFGIRPREEVDRAQRFSLIHRPVAAHFAPPMSLVDGGGISQSRWDAVMYHLARWLCLHLDDPRLVIWIAQRGGQLHPSWSLLIEQELNNLHTKEQEGRVSELDTIRSDSPNAIASPLMLTLWRLILSGQIRPSDNSAIYRWLKRLKREQLTTTLRFQLREALAPKVVLRKPSRWVDEDSDAAGPVHLRQLVDWELVLSADHVDSMLREQRGERWKSALPDLLEDFQILLRDALDLLRELGDASDRSDRSCWDLPSVTPHWQNRRGREWVCLIEFLRDAWLAIYSNNLDRATRIALDWFQLPYPTFKRLALFAASQGGCVVPRQWVDWLLADDAFWLWSPNTRREVLRLLVLQGRMLGEADLEHLEKAIADGAPLSMQPGDLGSVQRHTLLSHAIWLRLAKLNSSGVTLGLLAAERLKELSDIHPQWQLAADERDEFLHWISGTGDPDFEDHRDVDLAPRKRRDLVQWLMKSPPQDRPFYEDPWPDVCRTGFAPCLCALCALAKDNIWPTERWRQALQVWAEEGLVLRSWRYAAPLVNKMPDDVLKEIIHAVTWWLEASSKSLNRHEDILQGLCSRILNLPPRADLGITRNGEPINQPVTEAINHPIGRIAQALINLWYKRKPNDNDRLPSDLATLLAQICDPQVNRFRHGRVLLASNLIALFRADRDWTEKHLLPYFAWGSPVEATAVWDGFLWSPRVYQPLLLAFKKDFLETARHYGQLGAYRQNFAAFLTYAALDGNENFSVEDFRSAFEALPQDGLEQSAQALCQALVGAAGQREAYWKNRVYPFWQSVWPQSIERASPNLSAILVRLCLAAGREFPAAFHAVQYWLKSVDHPHFIIGLLCNSDLCNQFPRESLQLMSIIVEKPNLLLEDFGKCLDQIRQADPSLEQDSAYVRLGDLWRTRHS